MENKNSIKRENSAPEDAVAYFRDNPEAPVRILVSTVTHLVPGDGYIARTGFMANLISQHHWNHDVKWSYTRLTTKDALFGYDNRNCYILLDHGESPNDDIVPILWYRWTGESLVPIREALPSKIRRRLNAIPFTPVPRTECRQRSAKERRLDIRSKLRHDFGLGNLDFEFLKESPEHAIWLESNIEPRFWSKFKSLEAEWQEFQRGLACGMIQRIIREKREQPREKKIEQPGEKEQPGGKEEKPSTCREMWDCECSSCSE